MESLKKTHKKCLEAEKLGKKFGKNGCQEQGKLFRAQAEENHPGKALVPRLAVECFMALQALFEGRGVSPQWPSFVLVLQLPWSHGSSALVPCSVWAAESIPLPIPAASAVLPELLLLLCSSWGVC